jgi:hypothetical protein
MRPRPPFIECLCGDSRNHKESCPRYNTTRCYKCKKRGHMERSCTTHNNQQPTQNRLPHHSHDNRRLHHRDWVLDSGATDHMSPFREKFTNFQHCSRSIEVAGGNNLPATGVGDISIKLVNSSKTIILRNALFVPKLNGNLMSVPSMTASGFIVTMTNDDALVSTNNGTSVLQKNMQDLLAQGKRSHGTNRKPRKKPDGRRPTKNKTYSERSNTPNINVAQAVRTPELTGPTVTAETHEHQLQAR